MPHELKSLDEITDQLLDRTIEVYTKRSGDFVKFKLRTKKTLYTLKADANESDAIERRISSSSHSIEIIPK